MKLTWFDVGQSVFGHVLGEHGGRELGRAVSDVGESLELRLQPRPVVPQHAPTAPQLSHSLFHLVLLELRQTYREDFTG